MAERITYFDVWLGDGDSDYDYGLWAAEAADPVEVARAFIEYIGEDWGWDDLTVNERANLLGRLHYMTLFSVVKRDWDDIGEDCAWHSDGSGKRRRPAWFIEGLWAFNELVCERMNRAELVGSKDA